MVFQKKRENEWFFELLFDGLVCRLTKGRVHSQRDEHEKEDDGEDGSALESGDYLRVNDPDERASVLEEVVNVHVQPLGHVSDTSKHHDAVEKARGAVDQATKDCKRLDVGVTWRVARVSDEHAKAGSK